MDVYLRQEVLGIEFEGKKEEATSEFKSGVLQNLNL